MNQPPIPTDNLYKFMAIAGVVLMITALVLKDQGREKVTSSLFEANSKLRSLSEEAASSINGREKLPELSEAMIDQVYRKFEYLNKIRKRREAELFILFLIGFITAAAGFNLWYFRVQKYEDLLLRQRAK